MKWTIEELDEEILKAEEQLRQANELPYSSLKQVAIELALSLVISLREHRKLYEQQGWATKFGPDATR